MNSLILKMLCRFCLIVSVFITIKLHAQSTTIDAEQFCNRSVLIKWTILNEISGSDASCDPDNGIYETNITSSQLASIQELDLRSREIDGGYYYYRLIKTDDFDGLTGVRLLECNGCFFYKKYEHALPGAPSWFLAQLQELYLPDYDLSELMAVDFFKGLSNLRTLDLRRNNMTYEIPPGNPNRPEGTKIGRFINPEVWKHLPNLHTLYIGSNRILTLPRGFFRHLRNLEILDMYDMWYEYHPYGFGSQALPAGVFEGLTNLRKLDLGYNALGAEDIADGLFDGLISIEKIDLRENPLLTTLPRGVLNLSSGVQILTDPGVSWPSNDENQPITASLEDSAPTSHNGVDSFTVELIFSEELSTSVSNFPSLVTATNGTVTAARTVNNNNAHWEIDVQPDSSSKDVTLVLEANSDCSTPESALCTSDGRGLSSSLTVLVPASDSMGSITASLDSVPTSHNGVDSFTVELIFSEELSTSASNFPSLVTATNGTVTAARTVNNNNAHWEIDVQPDSSSKDVTLVLEANSDCSTPESALCTSDGRGLSSSLTVLVPASDSMTASLDSAPTSHNGVDSFQVRFRFSEELSTSASNFPSLVTATNGTVTAARTVNNNNAHWEIDVQPGSLNNIHLVLEANSDCSTPESALCTSDGRGLSSSLTVLVPASGSMTASLDSAPTSHNGVDSFTFELNFSENVTGLSYVTLTLEDSAFQVTNGEVTGARRLVQGSNQRWNVTVQPHSAGDITITLPETTDCTATGAICSQDGRKLSNSSSATILGPVVTISVADAKTKEDGVETVDFVVNLSRTSTQRITVNYATSNGTAVAGEDYTATSGTLTFLPGETSKTVSVPMLDDSTGKGKKFFTLTLSNPTGGAVLLDATAKNTEFLIVNLDSMPESHNGVDSFQVRFRFSEELSTSASNFPSLITATNGTVTAARIVNNNNAHWEIDVQPGSLNNIHLVLAANSDCSTPENALCTSDGRGLSDELGVIILTQNKAPTANAGENQDVEEDATVTLSGFGTDPNAGDTLSYSWTQIQGETVILQNADTATASFTAPNGLAADITLVFQLRVTDSANNYDDDTVTIKVAALPEEESGFTASLDSAPTSHNGVDSFTFELNFSENVTGLSYITLRDDSAFQVTNGEVTGASRQVQGANQHWNVTVQPHSAGDITITLPETTDCTATGAICSQDGRKKLSTTRSLTVSGSVTIVPIRITAEFLGMPTEHDGTNSFTFELIFSEDVTGLSYITLRDDNAFQVTNEGEVGASRQVQGANQRWNVTVQPHSAGDITITLPETTDCTATGAICSQDGRKLSNSSSATILGPVTISVADAKAKENEVETVDFVVSLSRTSTQRVTVNYATSNGTAVAGEDYTATSGILTFSPGETSITVSVPVLDDAIDEGNETFVLTLSNPTGGAVLLDATATGTIENTDLMPKAWLSRFGRTVADQVLEGIEQRLRSSRRPGVQGSVGRLIDLGMIGNSGNYQCEESSVGRSGSAEPLPYNNQARAGFNSSSVACYSSENSSSIEAGDDDFYRFGDRQNVFSDFGRDDEEPTTRSVSKRELLLGTNFSVTGETNSGSSSAIWGRVASSRFDGREKNLFLDGEVTTFNVGVDWSSRKLLLGLSVAQSKGEGHFTHPTGKGEVKSDLTGLYPYASYDVNERLKLWLATGYGKGDLTLRPEDRKAIETDMSLKMVAGGARGNLLENPEGLNLDMKTDAMFVWTESEAVPNMVETEADVSRLRFGLEGFYSILLGDQKNLIPSAEVGLRHDGGDAETGYGVDVGAGLTFFDYLNGIFLDARVRGLAAHESDEFKEVGKSLSLIYDPKSSSNRGLAMSLQQSEGSSSSGSISSLLGRETLEGLGSSQEDVEGTSTAGEISYGMPAFGGSFTGTPYFGFGLFPGGKDWRLGWRLGLFKPLRNTRIDFSIDGNLREADRAEPEKNLMMHLGLSW